MKQLIKTQFRLLIVLLLILMGGLIVVFSPASLTTTQVYTAVLSLLAIGLWGTGIIPEHITSLLFFSLAMLLSLAAPEHVFAGFSSSAFWLVFGGLIIGIAIKNTGLGKRIATYLVRHLEASYVHLISGVVVIGIVFSFLMPSAMARIVLIIPVVLFIVEHFAFKKGSNGRTGIVLAAIMGAFVPAFSILPANVANMVLAGMYETQFEQSLYYGEYLLLHFPVLGLLKAIIIIALVIYLYPDEIKKQNQSELEHKRTWTKKEIFLTILLVLALLFWITDFLHHISPAWIALLVALILLFPKIEIVSKEEFNREINYASLFFVAGIIGFGVVISQSGLANLLAESLLIHFPLNQEASFLNYMLLNLSAMLTAIFTTSPSVPAVLTPVAEQLSQASGLSLKTVVMTQVWGYSTTIFPYQAAPVLIALQLAGEKLASAVKFSAILALLTIVFLMPINFLWWRLLGWL